MRTLDPVLIGWSVALAGRLLAAHFSTALRRPPGIEDGDAPWRRLAGAIAVSGSVAALWVLYRRVRPYFPLLWPYDGFVEAVALVLVCSPMAFPLLGTRPHGWWLPRDRPLARIGTAAALSVAAVLPCLADPSGPSAALLAGALPTFGSAKVALFLLVFDSLAMIVLHRAAVATGPVPAVAAVAAAHLLLLTPAPAGHAEAAAHLLLLVLRLAVLLRSADLWWYWSVHSVLAVAAIVSGRPVS